MELCGKHQSFELTGPSLLEFDLLKYKIGRMPMMMDFLNHGSRDPYLYVVQSGSYFNYLCSREPSLFSLIGVEGKKILECYSKHVLNAKRVEEVLIINRLITHGFISLDELRKKMKEKYSSSISVETLSSCVLNLNLKFINDFLAIVRLEDERIECDKQLIKELQNNYFKKYLIDLNDVALATFDKKFHKTRFVDGFLLYEKYTRKDVLRILNWEKNIPGQNVGGYILHKDRSSLPIFVTYKKREDIAHSIKYEDKFTTNRDFVMISKSRRNLNSPEIVAMRNHRQQLRMPLFIQKSNDEGREFYYMGDVIPKPDGFEVGKMSNGDGQTLSIVKVNFHLPVPIEERMYEYITS